MRRFLSALLSLALISPPVMSASPAYARYGGGGRSVSTGPRGGTVSHGAYGGAAATGPHGGQAVRTPSGAGAYRGPNGGAGYRTNYGTAGAVGPHGGTAYRGAYGGTSVHGAYGGSAYRGPHGGAVGYGRSGAVYARPSYRYGGRTYARPAWGTATWGAYSRGFYGYPGWRPYGTWGLVAPLAGFAALSFLSAGMLVGSYAAQNNTVYVYVVNEGGQNWEYRVDSNGNIISKRPVSTPQG
ncbi:MAG: hypothetical protein JST54_14805 [Deltaproteobacteria bacterium]|nr:hypothetical protein [Deltaproteobacteria bacterium]